MENPTHPNAFAKAMKDAFTDTHQNSLKATKLYDYGKPGGVAVKPLLSAWVLLTYDIPADQPKVRYQFLKKAKELGAVRHTQSVYFMPWTGAALVQAQELASVGEVYLWTSYVPKPVAEKLTTKYAEALEVRLAAIWTRIERIKLHIEAGRLALAVRMAARTGKMLGQLITCAQEAGMDYLAQDIDKAATSLQEPFEGKLEV